MAKASSVFWKKRLELYDYLVDQCPRFKRKGKNMIYTSANGRIFSLLNKEGEIGIRFSNDVQEKYLKKFNTTIYKSYEAIMQGYILVPQEMLKDEKRMTKLLNENYDYVMSLYPK